METRREIIGFGRMTSDAAFVATVWDLVVAPTKERNQDSHRRKDD